MRRIGRGTAVAMAAVLVVAGCGRAGPAASGSPSAGSSVAPTTAGVRPMARIPAGTKVPLVRKGALSVCTEATGLPYIGEAGGSPTKVHGFDVDLLTLVATRLRVAPVFVQTKPAEYFDGTVLKKRICDLAPGLLPTVGARKTFALTKPYARYDFAILTKKGGPATLAALAGKQVGVTGGSGDAPTDVARYLNAYNAAHGNRIHVTIPMNNNDLQRFTLKEGRIAALVTDSGHALYYAKEDPDLAVGARFGSGYPEVFGVRKGDKPLVTQINAALTDAVGNGRYAKAYQTWFGTTPTWLPH